MVRARASHALLQHVPARCAPGEGKRCPGAYTTMPTHLPSALTPSKDSSTEPKFASILRSPTFVGLTVGLGGKVTRLGV